MVANQWYALFAAHKVRNKPVATHRMGVDLVLWRDKKGAVVVQLDQCPHKGVKLSGGRVIDGTIVCPYHGFRFDAQGACTRIPVHGDQAKIPASMCVRRFVSQEAHGLIWLWWGQARDTYPEVPYFDEVREAPTWQWVHDEIAYPVHYSRFIESNFDVYHFAFAHRSLDQGLVFGQMVHDMSVKTQADGCIDCSGQVVKQPRREGLPFRVQFKPGNIQLLDIAGQRAVVATVPVDDEHCIAMFRPHTQIPMPAAAWVYLRVLTWFEKHVVQPQDRAILATMAHKSADPGANRWVGADKAAARYVQWRARNRQKAEEPDAKTPLQQAVG